MEKFAVLILNDSLDNITDPYGTRSDSASYFAWLYILIVSLVLFCGIFGNLFIFISTLNTQSLRNQTGAFLMNLSVADFLVVITTLPSIINVAVATGEWRHGEFLCEVVGFAENIFTTASSMTIALISYERYLAIVRSCESHMNTHRTMLLGLLVWIVALLNGALPIINGSGYGFSLITHTCTVSWHLLSFELTCMLQTIRFFVPLAVLIYSYGRIILVAREARKQVSPAPASAGNHRPEKRSTVTDDTSLAVELASGSQTSMGSSASNVPSQPCDTDAVSNARAIGKNELSAISDNQEGKAPSTSGYVVATKPPLDVHKLNASQWPGDSSSVGQESFRTSYNMISALSGMTQQPTCNPALLFERKMNILRRRKASNTLFILVGVFFVCWAPYVFLTFRIQGKPDWRGNFSTTVVLLALANSSINVFLYGLTNTKYRREIQSFLKNCVSLNRLKMRFNVQVDQVQVATISKSIAKVRKESRTKYISHGDIPLASDPHNGRAGAKK